MTFLHSGMCKIARCSLGSPHTHTRLQLTGDALSTVHVASVPCFVVWPEALQVYPLQVYPGRRLRGAGEGLLPSSNHLDHAWFLGQLG